MTNLTFITGELGILGIVGSEAMDAGVSVGPQSLNMTKHAGIVFAKGYSNSVRILNLRSIWQRSFARARPLNIISGLTYLSMMSIFFLIFLRAYIMTSSAIWSEIWSLPDRHTKDSALTKRFLAATKIKRLRMGSRVDRYLKDITYQSEYLTRLVKEYKGHYLLTDHDTNHLDYKLALISSFSFCTRDGKERFEWKVRTWGQKQAAKPWMGKTTMPPIFSREEINHLYLCKNRRNPLIFCPQIVSNVFCNKNERDFCQPLSFLMVRVIPSLRSGASSAGNLSIPFLLHTAPPRADLKEFSTPLISHQKTAPFTGAVFWCE